MFGGVAKRIDQTLGSGPFLFSQDLDAALHVDVRSYIVVIFVTIFGAKSNNQNDVSAHFIGMPRIRPKESEIRSILGLYFINYRKVLVRGIVIV